MQLQVSCGPIAGFVEFIACLLQDDGLIAGTLHHVAVLLQAYGQFIVLFVALLQAGHMCIAIVGQTSGGCMAGTFCMSIPLCMYVSMYRGKCMCKCMRIWSALRFLVFPVPPGTQTLYEQMLAVRMFF